GACGRDGGESVRLPRKAPARAAASGEAGGGAAAAAPRAARLRRSAAAGAAADYAEVHRHGGSERPEGRDLSDGAAGDSHLRGRRGYGAGSVSRREDRRGIGNSGILGRPRTAGHPDARIREADIYDTQTRKSSRAG